MKNMRETVKAAGGLVINKKGEILFIFRKGMWDLPKGKLDSGELLDETAIRETSEETGIPLKKLKYNKELIPEKSEGIEECRWVSLDDFYKIEKDCISRIKYLISFYSQLLRYNLV